MLTLNPKINMALSSFGTQAPTLDTPLSNIGQSGSLSGTIPLPNISSANNTPTPSGLPSLTNLNPTTGVTSSGSSSPTSSWTGNSPAQSIGSPSPCGTVINIGAYFGSKGIDFYILDDFIMLMGFVLSVIGLVWLIGGKAVNIYEGGKSGNKEGGKSGDNK